MKATKEVIAALNACRKFEATLEDCLAAYWLYFKRERFHRLRDWFEERSACARKRKYALMERTYQLDQVPDNDRYSFEVVTLDKPENIQELVDYFLRELQDMRDAYEGGRDAAKKAGDTVTAKLLARGKKAIEDVLWCVEAKELKIKLVGPVQYLAHHMHPEK